MDKELEIDHGDFDKLIAQAKRSHQRALLLLEALAPIVAGLSARARAAQVLLGEDYPSVPTSDLYNPAIEAMKFVPIKDERSEDEKFKAWLGKHG